MILLDSLLNYSFYYYYNCNMMDVMDVMGNVNMMDTVMVIMY